MISFVCTSCSTSIGISRMPLFTAELNGLCDRLGDNERSIEGYRIDGGGLNGLPLIVVSGSGLKGISTIGLGDRCGIFSIFCDRYTPLRMGHAVFLDMMIVRFVSAFVCRSPPSARLYAFDFFSIHRNTSEI